MIKRRYQSLNEIFVSRDALQHNYQYFRSTNPVGAAIAPVLKSNAYGHGLTLTAKIVDELEDPPFLCVDSLYEAYELQKARIQTPILIMGYTNPENFKLWRKLSFEVPVFDEQTLRVLNDYQPGIKVHIKVDTGMNRLGLKLDAIPAFIRTLKKYPHVRLSGVYSHLATADNPTQPELTTQQVVAYERAVLLFEEAGYDVQWKHLGATAGASTLTMPSLSFHRLGIGFYGLSPFMVGTKALEMHLKQLRPAMRMTTHIAQIKTISPGDFVSYGATYIASATRTIAVLPIGYHDGLDRRMSNRSGFLVGDIVCPIVGRVCMNITMIDVTEVRARVGDRVTLILDQADRSPNVYSLARDCETIPYEILTGLTNTTRRTVV